ncbi:hypothetical protein [Bowdeniella massiliensis]|uniref:hypothetical protein n=1 Tax=Bowdeniella massiliensis TaxID=2932264 RepID=UPI002029836C|nr:hypothetical protein [Bowdeniella massiliensis]
MKKYAVLPFVVGLVLFGLTFAVSWPLFNCLTFGAGAAAVTAAAQYFKNVDTEKRGEFEVQPASGLRPSVATTAGAFREARVTGRTAERIRTVVEDYVARHHLSESQARQMFGADFDQFMSGTAHLTPVQAQRLLSALNEKDRS